MDLLRQFVDFFLHLDTHLAEIIRDYGTWTYAILFLIVFAETGLVVMPLLPGDSLLFAAAILGDTVNYWVGNRIGARAFSGNVRFLKREYLERTQRFYERHGGKTIILARFVPIVRTFAPFVAGVGTMSYPRFLAYNVIGAVVWVTGFVTIGYLFGNIPAVKERFSLVILAIIAVSVLPIAIEIVKGWLGGRREPAT